MDPNPYSAPRTDGAPTPDDDVAVEVSIVCRSCQAQIHIGEDACAGCQRPVTGEEKDALQRRWEASAPEVAKASDESYWGRVAIGVAAGLATFQAVLSFVMGALLLWNSAIAAVLWVLLVFSFSDPRRATAAALVVYLLWWFAPLVFAPFAVLEWVLLRIAMLMALIGGFAAERAMEKRRRAVFATARRRGP